MVASSRLGRSLLGLAFLVLGPLSLSAQTSSVARYFHQELAPSLAASSAKVRWITENPEAWYARWYLLQNAKTSIDCTYFNFYLDPFGKSFLGALLKKANQGVKVRLMVDTRGSFAASHLFLGKRYLEELGSHPNVEVRAYRGFTKTLLSLPSKFRDFIASNHDKILLVDGARAIMGGRNLGQSYFTDPQDDPHAYLDQDVLLEGGAVASQLKRAFEEEFQALTNAVIDDSWIDFVDQKPELRFFERAMDRYLQGGGFFSDQDAPVPGKWVRKFRQALEPLPNLRSYIRFARDPWQGRRALPTKILDKHSLGGDKNEITANLVGLLDSAQESIVIQSAYLVLTRTARQALRRAAARGVEIRIHTNSPASTKNLFVQAFFVRDWAQWMAEIPTLRIFMTPGPRKIHTKVFTVDDQVTLLGSYNIDPMSESINSEVVALIESSDLAKRARLRIEADLEGSIECKIRVEEDGSITKLRGPEDYLKGIRGTVIRWVSKLGFLRPLV